MHLQTSTPEERIEDKERWKHRLIPKRKRHGELEAAECSLRELAGMLLKAWPDEGPEVDASFLKYSLSNRGSTWLQQQDPNAANRAVVELAALALPCPAWAARLLCQAMGTGMEAERLASAAQTAAAARRALSQELIPWQEELLELSAERLSRLAPADVERLRPKLELPWLEAGEGEAILASHGFSLLKTEIDAHVAGHRLRNCLRSDLGGRPSLLSIAVLLQEDRLSQCAMSIQDQGPSSSPRWLCTLDGWASMEPNRKLVERGRRAAGTIGLELLD